MEAWAVPILTALISVCGALVSVVFSRRATRSERLDAAEQLAVRFREPLLQAAFNLETRIYNIVQLGFFRRFLDPGSEPQDREYAVLNTLYVVAQYFCWIEILRRESQFVDPRNDQRNAAVVSGLEAVRDAFSDSLTIEERCFRLFRGEQRALGEVMLVPAVAPPAGAPRFECLGYAPFVRALDDPQTGRWFERLRADIALLEVDLAGHDARLRRIQRCLMDIIDVLDRDARRVPAPLRQRLDAPETRTPKVDVEGGRNA